MSIGAPVPSRAVPGKAERSITTSNLMQIKMHGVKCMAVHLSDIHSLSEFQRNTREHIQHLKQSGKPVVLTVNGQAEVVVQSADAYQKLLDDQETLERIRGISRGMEQAKRGEGRPMREFLEGLAEEHGINLK